MTSGQYIQSIDVYRLDVPLLAPFTIASTNLQSVNNIVVAIKLENGITGFGEGATLYPVTTEDQATALARAKSQISYLLGVDVGNWRRIAQELLERLPDSAAVRSAYETALLDALARSWRTPLFQFFGGVGHNLITDITIPICAANEAERLAKRYRDKGFTTIKTKVGLDLDADLQRLQAIKRSHPQCELVLDANEGYTIEQALTVIRTLQHAEIDVVLFEQPVARDNWEGMEKLTRESRVRIAADESCREPADALRIAENNLAHVLNIKLAKCGVVQALEIAAIARANGLGLMMGEMVVTRLGNAFSAHFAAGYGGFEHIDLDTPFLLATDPITGGYRSHGASYQLDTGCFGHGCQPSVYVGH